MIQTTTISPSISANLIVKNEAHCIADCLTSIKPIVNEIIIVDTGSTDETIEICKKFTDKIYNFKWIDDFSAARNFAKSKTKLDWILTIDADEIIAEEDYKKILTAVNDYSVDGYIVCAKNYSNNSSTTNWRINSTPIEMRLSKNATGWFPSEKIRLFQNKDIYFFSGRIHELVQPSMLANNAKIKDADFSIYHYGYLFTESDKDKYSKKLEFYEKLNDLKFSEQRDTKTAFECAKQKRMMRKFDEALYFYQICIKENYRLADCYAELSAVYSELKDNQKAEDYGRLCVKLENNHLSGLNNLALALFNKKQYAEAINIYKKIIDLSTKHLNAYFNLAIIFEEQNDYISAENYYKKILEFDQTNEKTLKNLSLLLFKQNRLDETLKYLNILEKNKNAADFVNKYKTIIANRKKIMEKNDYNVLYTTAENSIKTADFKNAIINLRKCLSISPANCELHLQIAELYLKLGDIKKAELERERYNQCLNQKSIIKN